MFVTVIFSHCVRDRCRRHTSYSGIPRCVIGLSAGMRSIAVRVYGRCCDREVCTEQLSRGPCLPTRARTARTLSAKAHVWQSPAATRKNMALDVTFRGATRTIRGGSRTTAMVARGSSLPPLLPKVLRELLPPPLALGSDGDEPAVKAALAFIGIFTTGSFGATPSSPHHPFPHAYSSPYTVSASECDFPAATEVGTSHLGSLTCAHPSTKRVKKCAMILGSKTQRKVHLPGFERVCRVIDAELSVPTVAVAPAEFRAQVARTPSRARQRTRTPMRRACALSPMG